MAKKKSNTQFWNQLLLRSDAITEIKAGSPEALEETLAQLASITEQYDRVFDPVDAFEEYVAVALCQALQRAMALQTTERVCRGLSPSPVPSVQPAPQAEAGGLIQSAKSAENSMAPKPVAKQTTSATPGKGKKPLNQGRKRRT